MPDSAGSIGYGTLLKRGNGATPEVFSVVGECLDLDGPLLDKTMVDFTNQSSPDGYEEQKPGMKLATELPFSVVYVPGSQEYADLKTDWDNGTLRNFQFVNNDDTNIVWTFSAYVKTLQAKAPIKDKMTANVVLANIRGYTVS